MNCSAVNEWMIMWWFAMIGDDYDYNVEGRLYYIFPKISTHLIKYFGKCLVPAVL